MSTPMSPMPDGTGSRDYRSLGQIVSDVTHPFDDVAETLQALELADG